ncbi:hypothetical protein J6590_087096 [Homalodisca vitripennis]|nr:hypothetical protein J6590_087096 [Homalodisca vitripennis]
MSMNEAAMFAQTKFISNLQARDSCRPGGCRSRPCQALGRGEEGGLSETRRDRQGRSKIRIARQNLPAVAIQPEDDRLRDSLSRFNHGSKGGMARWITTSRSS